MIEAGHVCQVDKAKEQVCGLLNNLCKANWILAKQGCLTPKPVHIFSEFREPNIGLKKLTNIDFA